MDYLFVEIGQCIHVMCSIFCLVKRIIDALVLYELIVTHTVSASNKKSSFLKVDNEKRAMETLNASCIPCMDTIKEQREKSLIKFNVSYIFYLIPMPILFVCVLKHNYTLLGLSDYILGIWKTW